MNNCSEGFNAVTQVRANRTVNTRCTFRFTTFLISIGLVFSLWAASATAQVESNKAAMLITIINLLLDECVDKDKDLICAEDEAKYDFLSDENPLDAIADQDDDGLNNRDEINQYGSDPDNDDTDGDDIEDGDEVAAGTSPTDDDSDDDGIKDGTELALNLNPLVGDADEFSNISEADKQILHILNRVTFGPTAQLIDDVEQAGIATWLADQLLAIDLPLPPPHSGEQPTFGNSPNEVAHAAPYDCSSHTTPDPAQALRDCYVGYEENHLDAWGTIRPLHSIKQLQSRMAMFWDNHFNTDEDTHDRGMQELHDEDDFFVHAFGRFRTLLDKSARSYTMLEYLDLDDNRRSAPNENYPREILELHSTGIDGGYDELDIAELARILTGWDHTDSACTDPLNVTTCDLVSRYAYTSRPTGCDDNDCREPRFRRLRNFLFKDYDHDDGNADYNETGDEDNMQKILTIGNPPIELIVPSIDGNDGVQEGDMALDYLASHPSTANYICTKLAQEFVADEPQAATITNCETVFLAEQDSANQMGLVLTNLLESAEFNDPATQRGKLKDTQEAIFSLTRFLQWQATHPNHGFYQSVADRIRDADQRLFRKAEPTGYYETAENWLSTNIILNQHRMLNRIVMDYDGQSFEANPNTVSLVDYFKDEEATSVVDILTHVFKILYGGHYDGFDVQLGYDILNATDMTYDNAPFDIDASNAEGRLKRLLSRFVTQPAFHLH